jgi:hypothetical protein
VKPLVIGADQTGRPFTLPADLVTQTTAILARSFQLVNKPKPPPPETPEQRAARLARERAADVAAELKTEGRQQRPFRTNPHEP